MDLNWGQTNTITSCHFITYKATFTLQLNGEFGGESIRPVANGSLIVGGLILTSPGVCQSVLEQILNAPWALLQQTTKG